MSYDLVFVTTQRSVGEMIGKQAVHFMLWISAISPHISPHIPTVTARGRLWRVGVWVMPMAWAVRPHQVRVSPTPNRRETPLSAYP